MSTNRLLLYEKCPHCHARRVVEPMKELAKEVEEVANGSSESGDDENLLHLWAPHAQSYIEDGEDGRTINLFMRKGADIPFDEPDVPERVAQELYRFARRLEGAADALRIAFRKGGEA